MKRVIVLRLLLAGVFLSMNMGSLSCAWADGLFGSASAKDDLVVYATQPRAYAQVSPYDDAAVAFSNGIPPPVQGKFRLLVRVRAAQAGGLNIATGLDLKRVEVVHGWTAVDTATDARCLVTNANMQGIDYHIITWSWSNPWMLEQQMRSRPLQSVDATAPTIVQADFACDQPVHAGDRLSIQIMFYVEKGNDWVPASYDFEDQQAE